jgi:hypothetical protein
VVEGDEPPPLSEPYPAEEAALYSPHDLSEEDAELLAEYFGGADVTTGDEAASGEIARDANTTPQPGVDLFGD